MKLGSYINKVRLAKEISLRKFALATEIDVCYLSYVERNLRIPTKESILLKLANFLNIKIDVLKKLSFKNNMKKYESRLRKSLNYYAENSK